MRFNLISSFALSEFIERTFLSALQSIISMTTEEQLMFQWFNEAREHQGLPALQADDPLTQIARLYSTEQKAKGSISHYSEISGNPADRLLAGQYFHTMCLENLALAPSPREAFEVLMESPGHYENIMNAEVTHSGIGIDIDPSNEAYFVTQLFAIPMPRYHPKSFLALAYQSLMKARLSINMAPLQQKEFPDGIVSWSELQNYLESEHQALISEIVTQVEQGIESFVSPTADFSISVLLLPDRHALAEYWKEFLLDAQVTQLSLGFHQFHDTGVPVLIGVFW